MSALPDFATANDAELKSAVHEVALNQAYQTSMLQSGQGLLALYAKALAALN